MKKTILAAALMAATVTAQAEAKPYFGGGIAFLQYKEDGFSAANISALDINFGSQINEHLSIGGKFLIGLADGSIDDYGLSVDVALDWAYTLEIKPTLPLNETVNAYAVLGFTSGQLSASVYGYEEEMSDSGLTYGIGISKELEDDFLIRMEYAKYLDIDYATVSGFNIGIQKNFK